MLNEYPIFDCHLHIIDPRFPLTPNNGFLPEPFTADDYLYRLREYNLIGGAIVSGSFQALDQTYLIDTLNKLGPSWVGVTQLPNSVSDAEILELNKAGVRAVRFNVRRGGSEDVRYLSSMAARINELVGWHTELYIDSSDLPDLFDTIVSLPSVSVDHLGLSQSGFPALLKLAEAGVRVKATGFGRVDFPVIKALQQIYAANPDALMFGTDLPSTRAPRPYWDEDYNTVIEALGPVGAKKVFFQNAIDFYRPAFVGGGGMDLAFSHS